ncbi:hypothetical protein NP493_19g11045 [Ridgeia piscesae]|uniref:Receptor ligand binding region domain-containing protein n=1 Tax=Ridgeia piscesae TaxID=27915 RepID=A0AAD9UKV2_RIDPI|nr:hypothetical protein NP493_19g11045 [Ridgeia piscesae]
MTTSGRPETARLRAPARSARSSTDASYVNAVGPSGVNDTSSSNLRSRRTLLKQHVEWQRRKRHVCSTMSKGIFTFFGVANVSTMGTIDSYSRTFHMPFINPSVPLGDETQASTFTLRMRPPYHNAIIDVINYYKWRTVFYLYDTDEVGGAADSQSNFWVHGLILVFRT